MGLSTHVLDTARGRPATGMAVRCDRREEADGPWVEVARGRTDDDGRIADLAGSAPSAGVHRLTFDVGAWHDDAGTDGFWPEVAIAFRVSDPADHLHVPLLVSPYGYSTYRGS